MVAQREEFQPGGGASDDGFIKSQAHIQLARQRFQPGGKVDDISQDGEVSCGGETDIALEDCSMGKPDSAIPVAEPRRLRPVVSSLYLY